MVEDERPFVSCPFLLPPRALNAALSAGRSAAPAARSNPATVAEGRGCDAPPRRRAFTCPGRFASTPFNSASRTQSQLSHGSTPWGGERAGAALAPFP